MKRFILMCLGTILLTACKFKEDDVFEYSPEQRFEQTASEYEAILTGQENGWLMEFYAGDKQRYGGHNFILRFLKGHRVVAVSEHSNEEYTSQYSIDAVEGGSIPSLIFDTFSDVLHKFAVPTPQNIKGLGGDFEFNLRYQDGIFILTGKKWANEIRLSPLTEDKQVFLDAVRSKQDALRLAAFTPVNIDGQSVDLAMDLDRRRLYVSSAGQSVSRAFILTPSGIKLYSPLKMGSVTLSEMMLNADAQTLTTSDGSISTQLCFLTDELNLNNKSWVGYWVDGFASPNFLDKFAAIRQGEKSIFSGNYVSDRVFTLGKTAGWTGIELAKTSHRNKEAATFPVGYHFDFYAVPNQPSQLNIVRKTSGKNWNYFEDMEPLIADLTKYSPYEVQDATQGGETYKKFVSTLDPEVWFYLRTENTLPELTATAWTIDFYNGWMSQDLLDVFAASTSTDYTTSAFATLGMQSKWTSIQFSIYGKNNDSYYCNYLLDIVPVFGKSNAIHILDRKEGYNFKYFNYLKPVVDKLLEASPYELVPSGNYQRLMGGANRTTWLYKHTK